MILVDNLGISSGESPYYSPPRSCYYPTNYFVFLVFLFCQFLSLSELKSYSNYHRDIDRHYVSTTSKYY